jgi:hypothetical protein
MAGKQGFAYEFVNGRDRIQTGIFEKQFVGNFGGLI